MIAVSHGRMHRVEAYTMWTVVPILGSKVNGAEFLLLRNYSFHLLPFYLNQFLIGCLIYLESFPNITIIKSNKISGSKVTLTILNFCVHLIGFKKKGTEGIHY